MTTSTTNTTTTPTTNTTNRTYYSYRFSFEMGEKGLFDFMKMFDITANVKLYCVIHERKCKNKTCQFSDYPTIIINGNHFHVFHDFELTNLPSSITTDEIELLLPYEYEFDGIDEDIQYDILKYNYDNLKFETIHESIYIDHDYEVVQFKINCLEEPDSFKAMLKDFGVKDEYYHYKVKVVNDNECVCCLNSNLEDTWLGE